LIDSELPRFFAGAQNDRVTRFFINLLGIAIYNMRQGEGIGYETLFRDESVGALDAVNGKEYVRLLRRAMDLGGFHQVIFICHTPLVWELADDVLSVGGGCVVMGDREAAVTTEPLQPSGPPNLLDAARPADCSENVAE
jgi:ABC-type hemin transport system ATPase subunit